MWIYAQNSGQLFHETAESIEEVGCGYAGKAEGKNNPGAQIIHNVGPLPCGLYAMQEPVNNPHTGPYSIPLAPSMSNQMFGRSGFYIHGDSEDHPGDASDGCIVLGLLIRKRIWESGDHDLKVVAST